MAEILPRGGTVMVPWGAGEVPATVTEIQGSYPRTEVVATVSPELSGPTVAGTATVRVPLRQVRPLRRPV
jgi:hypothetical protein